MAVPLTSLGLILLLRDHAAWYVFPAIGGALAVGGYLAYGLMRPLYLGWMKLALALAWINTRILLGLFFYLVLTPIGLLMRLFGKDFLDEKCEKTIPSYWTKREGSAIEQSRYERLF